MKLNKLLVFFIFSFIFLYFSFRGRRAANRTKLIYLITKFLSVSECQRAIFMFCPYLGVVLEARHTGQGLHGFVGGAAIGPGGDVGSEAGAVGGLDVG